MPTAVAGAKDWDLILRDAREILWFESVDKRTWCYKAQAVYECPLRLYELEEKLAGMDFIRISKAAIVNFHHIRFIYPDFGGRLILTLESGDKQNVFQQYAPGDPEQADA